jgi:hypothetical protein
VIHVPTLIERLKARADNAYFDCIGTLRHDNCLGEDIKMEMGLFGRKELEHHKRAAEHLGRHRALHEVIKLIQEEEKGP